MTSAVGTAGSPATSNPIHVHPLTARLFGFPSAIAHGMWTKARCLAALASRLPDAFTVDVAFRKPILLPATVTFAATDGDGPAAPFGVRDAAGAGQRPTSTAPVSQPEPSPTADPPGVDVKWRFSSTPVELNRHSRPGSGARPRGLGAGPDGAQVSSWRGSSNMSRIRSSTRRPCAVRRR